VHTASRSVAGPGGGQNQHPRSIITALAVRRGQFAADEERDMAIATPPATTAHTTTSNGPKGEFLFEAMESLVSHAAEGTLIPLISANGKPF
jgi:hypothetical protein